MDNYDFTVWREIRELKKEYGSAGKIPKELLTAEMYSVLIPPGVRTDS